MTRLNSNYLLVGFDQDGMNESRLLWEADKPLSERLKIPRNQHFDAIPVQLLRKVGRSVARGFIMLKPTKIFGELIDI